MHRSSPEERSFFWRTCLNLFWNFVLIQGVVLALLFNISVLFPRVLPSDHVFVLDSAEYIDELSNYGSSPQEVDDSYLRQQWFKTDTEAG